MNNKLWKCAEQWKRGGEINRGVHNSNFTMPWILYAVNINAFALNLLLKVLLAERELAGLY